MDVGPVLRYKHGTGTGAEYTIDTGHQILGQTKTDQNKHQMAACITKKAVVSCILVRLEDSKGHTSINDNNKTSHNKRSHSVNAKIRNNKNLSQPDSRGLNCSDNINYLDDEDEKCVMCLQEKLVEHPRTETVSIKHRISVQKSSDDKMIQDKSDVREQELERKETINNVKIESGNSSKFIKRTRSFQRILRYSMLKKSKEYKL